ncbi:glycosyltransferase [Maribacter aestuarii]|uniref:glycosyltransferase n=1 Tax=Maribacter aestuarii TaxID=1130723 RepID=UPI0025A58ADA|nr:glycosyltransferase [Maribacter aestuarii]
MKIARDLQLNKKSVSILIYSLASGGAERFTSYLMAYFIEKEIDVTLILMENNIKYSIPSKVKIKFLGKSKNSDIGIIKFLKLPIYAYKYAKMNKELEINYSFSLLTRPNLINVLSKVFFGNESKVIISERAYPSLQYGYNNLHSKINKILISSFYDKSNLIIGNSVGNSNDLIENFNIKKKKIITIPNPVDIDAIDIVEPIDGFFDKDFFNLITIGRLDVGKNHRMLIKAINDFTNIRLYIIGIGELKNELQSLINHCKLGDRVFLLGHQKDPFKYLKSADLFIFGSSHEGFPNVLLEAMACGLPILSTNCKSGPEEILQLKKPKENSIMITDFGLLVPVSNTELMKEAIDYFTKNPKYMSLCKINVKKRVMDFEKSQILKRYTNHIFQ